MGLHKIERSAQSQTAAGRWLLPSIALLASALLLFGGEMAREWLRFDREGISSGELWRVVTGHFVHLGWPHFALNAAGLALVWYLVGDVFDRLRWLVISAISILTMDVGLWVFDPELMWYVGLSGLLHGILAAGLVANLRKPDKETVALSVLLLLKLVWEQLGGPLPGSEGTAGGAVVVDSHLFGALGGVLAAFLLRIRVRPATPI
jgi:rhomboid family GlyGly-CTERM serine protease